jgi:CBS domain-containing protein
MDHWIEEDLDLLSESAAEPARRPLDPRMLQESIRQLQPRPPVTLPPSASVGDAVALMREHRIGCVLIVAEDRLAGILTERDLLLKVELADRARPVAGLMTPDPEVLSPDDPIVYALNKMSVGGFRHVPLVDAEGRPVGIVSVKDIVDYIVDCFPQEVLTLPPRMDQSEAWRGRDGG